MTDSFATDGAFPSLAACVEAFSGDSDFLFRGEASTAYPHTHSMLERVRQDARLPLKARTDIEHVVNYLADELTKDLELPSEDAWGLIQHYEAPTDRLDFTANPAVACYFASGAQRPVSPGTEVLLAVLSQAKARKHGRLTDLRQHVIAPRAQRQHAFTLFVPGALAVDLKSTDARELFGLRWFRCLVTAADVDLYGGRTDLLDAHTDKAAGVLQLWIDSHPKVNDWSARWLANHVVAAPFVTKIVGRDVGGGPIVELLPLELSGIPFNEAVERVNNHRIWSNAYRDTRGTGGFSS